MSENLTPQQKQAVFDRGGRLLVSAAAGSGKTKVLVDRLMNYLTDPTTPANIDEFLIITYTKAAASELRGKIASKISETIARTGDSTHLLQQLQRLHLTKISTVHGFCADLLREYAYMLDISSDFRIADEEECIALRSRAIESVLEEVYADEADENVYSFIDTQGFGRDDKRIPEIVLQVYNAAKCHLNPDEWLDKCTNFQNLEQIEDMSQTSWGQYLINDLRQYLELQIETLQHCINAAKCVAEMDKPVALLTDTVTQLQGLLCCSTWDEICKKRSIDYGRLTFSKKCADFDLINQIKAIRDACKTGLNKKLTAFSDNTEQLLNDYRQTMATSDGLIFLVRRFDEVYRELKSGRRVLDFSDLEHKALDLLIGKTRSGATSIAREIGLRFREVMVDEYQDSNAVQDAIFMVLTEQRKNCFMVGDVKQSIYQFRLADPSIFIEKYNTYIPAETASCGQGRKVILSRNFRSSGAIIDTVNDVFETCMSSQVGGLDYGTDEALYEGIPHIPLNGSEVQLFGIDVKQDTYQEEASWVANKIRELLDGKHMIRHGDALRPIKPDDIVILLRSLGSVGSAYRYALELRGIPCASDAGTDLFQTEEVSLLHSILRVINNPLVDIPLTAVLLSRVFCFTADELAEIRKQKKYGSIYSAIKANTSSKVVGFLSILRDLRARAQLCSISQLIMHIFAVTRIDSIFSAMPDGATRKDNLYQFCQLAGSFESSSSGDLSKFLNYLETLSLKGISVSTVEKSTDAVSIMSIHKSKGLEFPVVFLCGLAREFNMENSRSQVLCDKELGLGLNCVDTKNRIQYPSIAKRAIAAKIRSESVSEEMRVLYVAMTRAKDMLFMTYSAKNVADELEDISLRLNFSAPLLLTSTAICPGTWILMTTIAKPSSALSLQIVSASEQSIEHTDATRFDSSTDPDVIQRIKQSLQFQYPYEHAVTTPSKQTASQMKGREKDKQAAEHTANVIKRIGIWRQPSFVSKEIGPTAYGTAMHAAMQYIRFQKCDNTQGVLGEITRLNSEGYISQQQKELIDAEKIAQFFKTDIGKQIRTSDNVLREFKFSVLTDAESRNATDPQDYVLLQGVVDCALVEEDGITIVDFKTDHVSASDLDTAAERYRLQVCTYADALSRIYQKPIKRALLYFFQTASFVAII